MCPAIPTETNHVEKLRYIALARLFDTGPAAFKHNDGIVARTMIYDHGHDSCGYVSRVTCVNNRNASRSIGNKSF